MAGCPKCGKPLVDGAAECPFCGIVVARWTAAPPPAGAPRAPVHPPIPAAPARAAAPVPPRGTVVPTWVLVAVSTLVVLGVLGVLAALYLFFPRDTDLGRLLRTGPAGKPGLAVARTAGGDFDRVFTLPVEPIGLAAGPGEWILGARDAEGGFLRLRWNGPDRVEVERVAVTEATTGQKISLATVAWNGESYVGYTTGAWFGQRAGDVFTLHDARTLQVARRVPAPPLLGGLAWDGESYWAATRKNTQDSAEEAYLYRLGPDLTVLERFEPPAAGCQGLAWDGTSLWFADVFTDSLILLDPSATPPRVTATLPTGVSYLSGVAAAGTEVWVCEYGGRTLGRLGPEARARAGLAPSPGAPPEAPAAASPEEVARLRAALRSEDYQERVRAEFELERLGLPKDYARDQALAPDRSPEECVVVDFALEMRDGELFGRWTTWFGEALFAPPPQDQAGVVTVPLFARYTVRVEGDELPQPLEREFEAAPGEHSTEWTSLAQGLPPGRYRASLFLHAQYIRPDGVATILNRGSFTLEVGY